MARRSSAEKFGSSTAAGAYLVLQGCLELAVADQLIKVNPAKSPVVQQAAGGGRWTRSSRGPTTRWAAVIDAHPDALRLLPVLMAGCGIRVSEAMGVALEDFDFGEKILHVRRQMKKLGTEHVYALPKNDLERDVPLPEWVAAAVRVHVAKYPPRAVHAALGEAHRQAPHAQHTVPVG